MEDLKQAFYEVMHKYKKSFSEAGVTAILEDWTCAKSALAAMLRRHPDWDEEAKAIVFRFSEGRKIEHDVVDEAAFSMSEIASEILTSDALNRFTTAFRAAVSEYSNTLTEDTLEVIRENSNITCVTGQKTSRIIGRLCRAFGLDKHERYNAVFARLADSLNPLVIEKTALLSIHPCDFMEMSNKDNEWHSCHRLNDGSYQSGCLSYLCDTVSMIFYTVDNNVKDHFYRHPKLTREMFFYTGGHLFQSRLYPQDYYEPMEQYRGLVQRAIAACLDRPNLWILKEKRSDFEKHLITADNSTHYPDYDYYGNLSILKGSPEQYSIEIGSQSRCVCCGNYFYSSRQINCGQCTDLVVCKECGKTIPRNDAIYTDAFYCKSCAHICSVCGTTIQGTSYPVMNRQGKLTTACLECYSAALNICSSCHVQNACKILKCTVLCPHTTISPVESEAAA